MIFFFSTAISPGASREGFVLYNSLIPSSNSLVACDKFCVCLPLCSRTLAESSPYFEALKQKDVEVLFCYEPYDELVLMQLRQFDSRNLTSVEKEMRQDKESDDLTDLGK